MIIEIFVHNFMPSIWYLFLYGIHKERKKEGSFRHYKTNSLYMHFSMSHLHGFRLNYGAKYGQF